MAASSLSHHIDAVNFVAINRFLWRIMIGYDNHSVRAHLQRVTHSPPPYPSGCTSFAHILSTHPHVPQQRQTPPQQLRLHHHA
eukprot:scaffold26273_cov85-Skeletonema_marinoi.AAC.2